MKRRSAIKNLMIFAGGIYLLPSCAGDGKSSIELKNLDILVGEEALLGEVAEAMIPKTAGAPGARDLNLHLFTLKMVDDCHSAKDQKAFKAGLISLNKTSLEKNNKPFNQLDAIARTHFIESTLKDTNDEFLPGLIYVKKYNYPALDKTETVPYNHGPNSWPHKRQ